MRTDFAHCHSIKGQKNWWNQCHKFLLYLKSFNRTNFTVEDSWINYTWFNHIRRTFFVTSWWNDRRITTPGRQILANSGAQKGTAGHLLNAESCLRSYQKNITSDGNEVVKNPN